jgi:hypothetical protein
MAGLDSEGSPFNGNAKEHMQSFHKSFNKSNGFSGDISSNGHVNNSFRFSDKPVNGNFRPKPYLSSGNVQDPVMNDSQDQSGYMNDSHDEAQKRRDELYERILRDTSSAFNRLGEQNITIDVSADTTGTLQDDKMAEDSKDHSDFVPSQKSPEKMPRSRIPRPGVKKRGSDSDTDYERSHISDQLESMKGPGGEIIMSLSPFDDDDEGGRKSPRNDEVVSPERGGQTSRVSDFSYGMDSFEQSYVSEREEVVHLGDDMDYPESPSPIRQDSDNDDF